MDLQTLLDALTLTKRADLASCLQQGDLMEEYFALKAAEMKELRKKLPQMWQDMGGSKWKKVAQGDLAVHLHCSSRTVMLRRQVSGWIGPDKISRNPMDDQPDVAWTLLAKAVKFGEKTWDAVQWAMANDLGSGDMQDAQLIDGQFVVVRRVSVQAQEREGKKYVTCPCGCGVTFEVALAI